MRDGVLTSLTGMALSKSDYLNNFEKQEHPVWKHLIKILTISSDSEWHWIDEVNVIFGRLARLNCKASIKDEELRNTFKSFDINDGKDWAIIADYCESPRNSSKSVYIYESRFEPCKYVSDIMDEFISRVLKGEVRIELENLTYFKKALKLRSIGANLFTLKQVLKLKNKIWEK